jgi:hypothetical protein
LERKLKEVERVGRENSELRVKIKGEENNNLKSMECK